jgi:O-antigen/teichoic acid export membrane protein
LFQPFQVIDCSFQAQIKAKYSSLAKSIALAISSLIKIYLVEIEANLLVFAIVYALDQVFIALFLLNVHFLKQQQSFLFSFDRTLVKPLLTSAWPMAMHALAGVLLMRVDQIMIQNMLDSRQLGLYAAATKFYEAWLIIPYILSVSLLPAIVKLKSRSKEVYEVNLARLIALLFWSGIIVAIFATIYSGNLILLAYGEEYIDAEAVIPIVIWAGAFTAVGSVSGRYLLVEHMEKKLAFRTIVAVVINIILNLVLIPNMGIKGAAMSTLVTIIFSNFLIIYLDKQLKQLASICSRAVLLKLTK